MATVAKKLMTAEEFSRLPDPPDGSQQELVRGEVVTMPPPKGRHGVCCAKIILRLGQFVQQHELGTVVCNDTGFVLQRDPDMVRGPDVSYWSWARLPDIPEEYIEVSPELAVEVVSPSDVFSQVQRRVRDFLASGVLLIWIVDPENRTVTVHRPSQQPRVLEDHETIDGQDVLPGFTCPVAEFLP